MMPKDKAMELYKKMCYGFQHTIDDYTAKQVALIAVDEILSLVENVNFIGLEKLKSSYWIEVRNEIKKL